MPVKADSWIRKMAIEKDMIEPFSPELVKSDVVSFGVSSYGYDFRIGYQFKKPIGEGSDPIDPKGVNPALFKSFETRGVFYLKENSIVIAQSLEHFKMPRNVIGICYGKSTYARCGLIVNITPLEPEWEGILTFPLINNSTHPIKIYPGEGIAQVIFIESDSVCETSYADRKGKYQGQKGVTLART